MTLCWLNGAVLDVAAARIDPRDRGYTLGDGVFETIAVRDGLVRHLARHLARLRHGAEVLELGCGWDDAAIGRAIGGLVGADVGVVRLTLSRGVAARGLLADNEGGETLSIVTSPPVAASGPVAAIVCGCTRRNEASPLARIKSLNYLDSILARQEARDRGAQEAILLNTQGRVAEATAANVFVRVDGRWVTPPVAEGALPGIARQLLLERAGVAEMEVSLERLVQAEAMILSNSLGLREVTRLDARNLGAVGPVLAAWGGLIEDRPIRADLP